MAGGIDVAALDSFAFGDSPAMADELLGLVLEGRKTATCWAAAHGLNGADVGKAYAVLDGRGRPRAVIETVELTERRFDEVDAAFAFEEGEDDRSLAAWRTEHERFFTREGTFAPDMPLWCERFRLVQVLGDGAE
jgi:uncharacterized protein YhfF